MTALCLLAAPPEGFAQSAPAAGSDAATVADRAAEIEKLSAHILHINFRLNVPRAEYEEIAASLAGEFARLPGLIWKVWLMKA